MQCFVAIVVCTVLGVLVEGIAYRPLREGGIAAGSFDYSHWCELFASERGSFNFWIQSKKLSVCYQSSDLKLAGGSLVIPAETIVTIISCIVIMIVLTSFINKTKPGQAMLAVSEDKGAAQLMGINVNRTIALTFAIGSGLAAIAGVLYVLLTRLSLPYTGSMPGIKAFVAAVFGGIGSIPGAMVGGILLGVIEILAKAYISSQLADAIVFAVLIIVLLVKPTRLFGREIQEKV